MPSNCASYGFVTGIYVVNENLPPVPRWSMVNAFPNDGRNWGRLDA